LKLNKSNLPKTQGIDDISEIDEVDRKLPIVMQNFLIMINIKYIKWMWYYVDI
jgi:hypothetical protein